LGIVALKTGAALLEGMVHAGSTLSASCG